MSALLILATACKDLVECLITYSSCKSPMFKRRGQKCMRQAQTIKYIIRDVRHYSDGRRFLRVSSSFRGFTKSEGPVQRGSGVAVRSQPLTPIEISEFSWHGGDFDAMRTYNWPEIDHTNLAQRALLCALDP
jgi:hypothetical protein